MTVNRTQSYSYPIEELLETRQIDSISKAFGLSVGPSSPLVKRVERCFGAVLSACQKGEWKKMKAHRFLINGLCDSKGATVLESALRFLKPADVETIFKENLAFCLSSGRLMESFHKMVQQGRMDLFKEALQHVDINHIDDEDQTLLHWTIQNRHFAAFSVLLACDQIDLEVTDRLGRTPALLAAELGQKKMIVAFIQQGVDPNQFTNDKKNVIHALAKGGCFELINALLLRGKIRSPINTCDIFGNTPLHTACTVRKNVATIKLLIDRGVKINTPNKEGDTPLHLAARGGDLEAVELLKSEGARWDIYNDKSLTAVDEALLRGFDVVASVFLKIDRSKLENLEGYKHDPGKLESEQKFLWARSNKKTDLQLFFLIKTSFYLFEKGGYQRSLKILNSALAILNQSQLDLPEIENFLFTRMSGIERVVARQKKYTIPSNYSFPVRAARKTLQQVRKQYLDGKHIVNFQKLYMTGYSFQEGEFSGILESFRKLTLEYKKILREQISDLMKFLGKKPKHRWACIGLGSMARGEMSPYSDLEFGFLIESTDDLEYFRDLSELLELRLINFGETEFQIAPKTSPTPDGFCLDAGGNGPLGNRDDYELIQTPKSLAGYLTVQKSEENVILPNILSTVCWVTGDSTLVDSYEREKNKALNKVQSRQKKSLPFRRSFALKLLKGHLSEFKPSLTIQKEELAAFGIKQELYRPFQAMIGSLALYYGLKSRSSFQRLEELQKRKIFSSENVRLVQRALARVFALRFEAHLFYRDEKDFLLQEKDSEKKDPNYFYLDQLKVYALNDTYQMLYPFHHACMAFFENQKNIALFQHPFNSNFFDQGLKALEAENFTEANALFQRNVIFNEKKSFAYFLKAYSILKSGKIEGVSSTLDSGLKGAYRDEDFAYCYLARAMLLNLQKKYGESLVMSNIGFFYAHSWFASSRWFVGARDKYTSLISMLVGEKFQSLNALSNFSNQGFFLKYLEAFNAYKPGKQGDEEYRDFVALYSKATEQSLMHEHMTGLMQLAQRYRKESKRAMAISTLFEIERFYTLHVGKDSIGLADCLRTEGEYYLGFGDGEKALLRFAHALWVIKSREGKAYEQVSFLTDLGNAYLSLKMYREAISFFKELERVAPSLGKKKLDELNHLMKQSKEESDKLLKELEITKDKLKVASIRESLGTLYFQQGAYKLAEESISSSLEFYQVIKDKTGAISRLKKIEEEFKKMIEVVEKIKRPDPLSTRMLMIKNQLYSWDLL